MLETDLNWSKTYMNLRAIWRIKNTVRWFFSFIKTDIVEDKYFEKRADFKMKSDNMKPGANYEDNGQRMFAGTELQI